MTSPVLGEFMGTLILILLGDGVVAGVLLKHSKSENAGLMVITAGWAFAVMAGVFTAIAFGSPDGHLNPAVTLGAAVATGDFSKVLPYSVAQLAGAFVGAVLVWLHYLPHWRHTTDANAKLAVFCTAPAIRNYPANVLSEAIGTFVLVFVGTAVVEKGIGVPLLGAPLAGALVWGIGLSLGATTGYAINPARDLGPRLAHAILPIPGKSDSDWSYAWVPIVGPLLGGAAGALLAKAVITAT